MELIKPNSNINFVGRIRAALIFSLVLIAISLLSLVIKGGPRYGIDFEGGTLVQIKFFNPVDIGAVRNSLDTLAIEGLSVQNFGEQAEQEYLVTMKKTTGALEGLSDTIRDALTSTFGDDALEVRRVEMVGPKVGEDLRQKALYAIFFALLFSRLYIRAF